MNRYVVSVLFPLTTFLLTTFLLTTRIAFSQLTAAQESDSYEIYSMLLRTEMPPQWKITSWAIQQETRGFPPFHHFDDDKFGVCLRPGKGQEAIYLPLIEDYAAKNRKPLTLARKFDLPQYELVDRDGMSAVLKRHAVIFHVSAAGFNPDGSRALVYVGHDCGSLCGGGQYHLLVKKDGKWQADQEFKGLTCTWAS